MENNNFYTYGMIKPDAIDKMEEIIKMIYDSGLEVHYMKLDNLTSDIIDENYDHCRKMDFYHKMKKNLLSGPVLKMLIYDPNGNAVINYRKVLGPTKSSMASSSTIRGRFGNKEVTYKNAAHGSGSEKEAQEEIIRFFKNDLDMMLYELRRYTKVNTMNCAVSLIYGNYEDLDMSLDKELDIKSRLNKVKNNYYRGV